MKNQENNVQGSPVSPALEILAPAGNFSSLIAAVRSGANAVYFGADCFNARQNAENFSGASLVEAVDYCRLFGVKTYLTLNTLIANAELPRAVELAVFAANAGVDALIVQDIGLCSILHSKLPQIELHASTQMSVHSPAALPFLKELGITRVVAAREMSQTELQAFCRAAKKLDIEVEVFVHGALCMSVSGQCYFSAFLGGRSANRGLCAGTCRLPFFCGKAQNALSLKDLSLIHHLQTLQKLGVASAKIEGRMKRPEYVAAAVHCAVTALKNGAPAPGDEALLRQVFSRSGFTNGYFTGRRGSEMFGARSKDDAVAPATLKQLHQYYRVDPQPVLLAAELKLLNNKIVLTLTANGQTVSVFGPAPEAPQTAPLSREMAQACLEKLGGTPYRLNQFILQNPLGLTVRLGNLNRLKSNAVQILNQQRLQAGKQQLAYTLTPPAPRTRTPQGWFLRLQQPGQLPQNLLGVNGYSLPAGCFTAGIPAGFNKQLLWAELPRTNFNEIALLQTITQLKRTGVQGVVAQNIAQIKPALTAGLKVFAGFGLNIFNSYTAQQFLSAGLSGGVLSPELSLAQLPQVCAAPPQFALYSFCYGYFPLMLLRNCPVKAHKGCQKHLACSVTDRKGERFTLHCSGESIQLYNNRPIYVGDKLSQLSANGCYLYFTSETAKEVETIITLFRNGQKFPGSFTKGLLQNGVK